MKILEVIPELEAGGAEVFLVNLSNELANKKNVDVTILTLYPINKEKFLVKKISSNINVISFKKKNGVDLNVMYQIYKLIIKEKFDIAHFHVNAIIYSILSVLLYRKCAYYATIHSDAYEEAKGLHRYVRKFMFSRNLMTPITISEESDKSFQNLYKKRAKLIYNGVPKYEITKEINLNSFKNSDNTKIFVNVASIQPLKNQITLARVFNQLANEGEDVVLLIIGRTTEVHKEYAEELMKMSSKNVHLLGETSNPRDYVIKADYFILPSHYEGLPISLLESISVGCIPIVTAVGGNINVVKDGHNGYVIPNSSEEAIYSTLKLIIKSKEKDILRIRTEVEVCSEKYTIEHCANMYLNLFKS